MLFVFLFLQVDVIAQSEDPESMFNEANLAYKEGRFGDAVIKYEDMIDNGYISADIYYNLGNAYYRLDNLGYAILNFERSVKLNPSREDAKHNLALAKAKTIDNIEPVPGFFLSEIISMFIGSQDSEFWSWSTITLLWLTFCLLALFILGRSPSIRRLGLLSGMIFLVMSVFSLLAAWNTDYSENLRTDAIVMSSTAYVRSEPNDASPELFVLHEGTKAEIINLEGNYFFITLADGNKGWIEQTDIERI